MPQCADSSLPFNPICRSIWLVEIDVDKEGAKEEAQDHEIVYL